MVILSCWVKYLIYPRYGMLYHFPCDFLQNIHHYLILVVSLENGEKEFLIPPSDFNVHTELLQEIPMIMQDEELPAT